MVVLTRGRPGGHLGSRLLVEGDGGMLVGRGDCQTNTLRADGMSGVGDVVVGCGFARATTKSCKRCLGRVDDAMECVDDEGGMCWGWRWTVDWRLVEQLYAQPRSSPPTPGYTSPRRRIPLDDPTLIRAATRVMVYPSAVMTFPTPARTAPPFPAHPAPSLFPRRPRRPSSSSSSRPTLSLRTAGYPRSSSLQSREAHP